MHSKKSMFHFHKRLIFSLFLFYLIIQLAFLFCSDIQKRDNKINIPVLSCLVCVSAVIYKTKQVLKTFCRIYNVGISQMTDKKKV